MKQVNIELDAYENYDVRKGLEAFTVFRFKLTQTNKCYVREIAGGVSARTGKEYTAFKTYSIKGEHNGVEGFIRIPNAMIAGEIEKLSVGDTAEITCLPHPKGKSFVLEKIEVETQSTATI